MLLSLVAADLASAATGDLIRAVKRRDRPAVQALLKQGANVNETLPDGATALHYAALENELTIAEALVKAGANAKVINQLGMTPLHLACLNGSATMAELLLKAGADPNGGVPGRETPVMTAARVGVPVVMKLLLAHGGNPNATESLRGQTAAMWAAAQKHPETLQLLIETGADVQARTRMPPARRQPGMQPAANAGNVNAVNPDERLAGGSNAYTPLLFAARVGDIESARLLIKAGAKVNDVDALGLSPLVLSTVRGFSEFATFLLDQGADPNLDDTGFTALHWAAGTWESELTVRAITTEREDGEWYTVAGLKEGKLALVSALLKHGADPNAKMWKSPERAGSSKNPQLSELGGATPLILAAMAGNAEVMKTLVAGGADPDIKTWSDGTVLMAAAGLGHVQGEDLVTEVHARGAAEAALAMGNSVTDVDAAGNTPLHYASYMRHDSVVQLLVDRGAPLNAKNKFGETPLWTSALVVQFAGGGTYQLIPSTATDILKKAGATQGEPLYARARPTDWPDNARSAADQVADPDKNRAERAASGPK